MSRGRLSAAAMTALVVGSAAGGAHAGSAGADARNRAAVFRAVSDCRTLTEDAARLACYDQAVGALDVAEQKGDLVVIDREQAKTVRREAFGFNLPSISLFNHAVKDEAVDKVQVELAGAHRGGDGRWVLVTTTDQVWRQTEGDDLYTDPKSGSKMQIKRGALGSYFCKVDGQTATRCKRDR